MDLRGIQEIFVVGRVRALTHLRQVSVFFNLFAGISQY